MLCKGLIDDDTVYFHVDTSRFSMQPIIYWRSSTVLIIDMPV